MERLYLYFDGVDKPILTFSVSIMNDIYEWCRALAMTFTIDGYCFRPCNTTPRLGDPSHMEVWDKDQFVAIFNNI